MHRRRGLQVASAEGNVEKVQRALTKGLFANAVRYVGTAYDIKDLQSLGQHTYQLIRSTGPGLPFSVLALYPGRDIMSYTRILDSAAAACRSHSILHVTEHVPRP